MNDYVNIVSCFLRFGFIPLIPHRINISQTDDFHITILPTLVRVVHNMLNFIPCFAGIRIFIYSFFGLKTGRNNQTKQGETRYRWTP